MPRPNYLVGFLFVAAAIGVPSAAMAQPPASKPASVSKSSSPPLSDSLTGPAKQAYEAAKLLFQNGDAIGAVAKFNEAYELAKDPRLLFNIAVAEKALHHYARMQSLLRRYVSESGDALAPGDRSTAEAALAAIENLVGALAISVNQEGAEVSVDGVNIGISSASPVKTTIDLGTHAITVKKDGWATAEKSVEITGGKDVPIEITLVRHIAQGRLVIASDEGAAISVDGTFGAKGHYEASVPAGTHEISVAERGKITHVTSLEVHDDETRSIEVTLADTHNAPIWPWIAGGAAVLVAGAAIGGYYLFRPHNNATTPIGGSLGTVTLP